MRAIHNDIGTTLGPNIVGYGTITRDLREAKFLFATEEASDTDDRKLIDDADEAIVSALSESPFVSRDSPTSL
jgi:hypothetical protein